MRMWVILGLAVAVLLYGQAPAGAEIALPEGTKMTVYKSPHCDCCGQWVAYLRQRGMDVTVVEKEDMDPIKKMIERYGRDHFTSTPAYMFAMAINYIMADGGYLCAECANGGNKSGANVFEDDPQWQTIAQDVYWEGPTRYCDHCNGPIESEYGDPKH